jgi:asparagine synthase (glutamine-hydrolysing)
MTGSQAWPTRVDDSSRPAHLRLLLENAVWRSTANGILLSGGLDTSVLSALAAQQGRRLGAVSVSVADAVSPDEPFAKMIAERYGFPLEVSRPSLGDLIAAAPDVMRVLGGFDPMELRNSVVTWLALKAARERGIAGVLTGDAADELFAGYSYIFNMRADQVSPYLRFLNGVMRFSSIPMAEALGIEAHLPYIDPHVREFALSLSVDDLTGERNGQRFGKKILRQAFADLLPEEITWRVKTPIEYGSGSRALQKFVTDSIPDNEFEAARVRITDEDGVSLRDKEQFFYYRIYRSILLPPCQRPGGMKRCSACGGPVERAEQKYCRICGAYPC